MARRKVSLQATLMAFCLVFLAGAASAWEFETGGCFNWTYEWYGQRDANGFFGKYDRDSGAGTFTANLNFWNGGQFDTNISSSKDAGWSYFSIEFFPVIKLNEAIRFKAKYRIGTYGDPRASDYHTFDAPGTIRAFGEGQWTMFWVTAQTPLGIFAIGKRPWAYGTAVQYGGEDATTTESIFLVAPYGPLDIGIAFYPYRFAGTSSIAAYAPDDPFNVVRYTDAFGLFTIPGQYYSRADKSGSTEKDFLAFVSYHTGTLSAGILGSYTSYHIGPESVVIDPLFPPATPIVALDSEQLHGTTFVKYFNGRLFFNAEAAWLYWTDRFKATTAAVFAPPNTQALVGLPNPRYVEQWRYALSFGALVGPAKVTFLHAWMPGPDRRAGVLVGKQAAAFVDHPNFDRYLDNYLVFKPFSYIFAYNYGGGLNAYNLSGNGYLRDASVLAARLDYAVAANLNLFGSFFYANRTSHGYSWGCIGPNAGLGAFSTTPYVPPNGNILFNINRYAASPNIPDNDLGYEMDLGFDWQLLDGWTVSVLAGYWQPGKWFRYACIDRSVPGWETGAPGNFFGTSPSRVIDPIIGGQFAMTFSF